MPFISGEQGNKSLKLKGTREQRQFGETGNIENQDFDFGRTRKNADFSGQHGKGTPWEGIITHASILLECFTDVRGNQIEACCFYKSTSKFWLS